MSDVIPAWSKPAAEWGDEPPLCVMRCMRPAALTIDREPYCIDCADEAIERLQAIDLRPDLVDVLPVLGRHEDYETIRRRLQGRMPRRVQHDSDELREMGKAWLRSPWNPANGAADPNAGRAGRRPPEDARQPVTRDEPHEAPGRPEPAGQLSLLASES